MNEPIPASRHSLLLGFLLGAALVLGWLTTAGLSLTDWPRALANGVRVRTNAPDPTNGAEGFGDLTATCVWSYLRINQQGWSTDPISDYRLLDRYLRIDSRPEEAIAIPVLPSVYPPTQLDKLYYDAILQSQIAQGDKVLVIGAGSGADSWAAAHKTKSPVYAIDINPMAVMNTRVTARIGGFDVKPIHGDFRTLELPDDFRDFDYVLWNMPFVEVDAHEGDYAHRAYHDGDDGSVLQALLAKLPALLKPGGQAILLNYALAKEQIDLPGVVTKVDPLVESITNKTFMLFIIPNPTVADTKDRKPFAP